MVGRCFSLARPICGLTFFITASSNTEGAIIAMTEDSQTITALQFNLSHLPPHVKAAGYDQKKVTRGIVHIGPGAFWSAHFGAIIHDYMEATGDLAWGFAVASLRSHGTIAALRRNKHRYALIEREEDKRSASVIASVVESIFAPEDPTRMIDAIADGATKIVSMTITNKGYYLVDSCGTLDAAHQDIVHDLDFRLENSIGNGAPRTIYWYLTEALKQRSQTGAPLTVISLDNVAKNSASLKKALIHYVQASLPDSTALVVWIEANVDFLTTLVDRITPEVTAHFRKEAAEYLGFEPGVVVGTEVFRQLVVEQGRFPVPGWQVVGVETVENIDSYWELKFLGLNAAHQVPAMVGQRLGVTYIHEAMSVPEIAALLELFHTELGVILGADLMSVYGPKIQRRFKDSAPMDTLRRVAARATSKASERLGYAIDRALALTDGKHVLKAPIFVLACYLLNLGNSDELGNSFHQDDVEQHKLSDIHQYMLAWTRAKNADNLDLAHFLRRIGQTLKDNRFIVIASHEGVVTELSWALKEISSKGTRAAITSLLSRVAAEPD